MTEPSESVSLREHLEIQIQWLDRYVDEKLRAIDINTDKALAQLDKRLEGMNEFRDALKDKENRLMTRIESDARIAPLEERVKTIELSRAEGEGKLLIIAGIIAFFASVLVAIIVRWLTA